MLNGDSEPEPPRNVPFSPKRFGVDRQSLRTAFIGDLKFKLLLIVVHPVRQLHILIPAVFARLGGCVLLCRPDDERHFVNADAAAVLQPPLIHIAADGRHILIEGAFLSGVQLGELVPLRIVLVPWRYNAELSGCPNSCRTRSFLPLLWFPKPIRPAWGIYLKVWLIDGFSKLGFWMAFSPFGESSAAADGAGSSVIIRINANKALIHRFPTIFCLSIIFSFVRLLIENQCRLTCIYCFLNAYSRVQIHGLGPVQFARLSYGRLTDSGLINAILPQLLHPDFALKTWEKVVSKERLHRYIPVQWGYPHCTASLLPNQKRGASAHVKAQANVS